MNGRRFGRLLALAALLLLAVVVPAARAQTADPAARQDKSTAVEAQSTTINLPQGQPVYKIEVLQDGIYEISGADLDAAGMDLNTVTVNTLQMMHRGQPVAFQFINTGGGAAFEPQDKIRFYGWAFDGSRYEDMFIDRNYYWLWSGGTQQLITTEANEAPTGHQAVTSFPQSVTYWPHQSFYTGGGIDWDASPNDPTPWHIVRLSGLSQLNTIKRTYDIDLLNPVPSAAETAVVTAEVTSRQSSTAALPLHTYTASTEINAVSTGGSVTWYDQGNVNAVGSVTGDILKQPGDIGYPTNKIRLSITGSVTGDPTRKYELYVTRFTVDYQRQLLALGNELQFQSAGSGVYDFQVDGFSESSPANALVWDVSNRLQPVAITLAAGDISASEEAYLWSIRRAMGENGRLIATTPANVRAPQAITQVVPQSLTPAGGAAWVAISHNSLLPAAQDLADHRAVHSGLSTWVIDVQQIIDQVGYGYHLPTAIKAYVQEAYNTWSTPPAYLTLVGDATFNPRYLDCPEDCGAWDKDKPHLVATDLLFVDRFAGLIPVDHSYAMLAGDDYTPEIAVARLPAENLAEAQNMVAKVIRYEANLGQMLPQQNHFLFVADNTDGGGNFCQENISAAGELPPSVSTTQLCLPNGGDLDADTATLRSHMFDEINNVGVLILNYRGHGSINKWADPAIMTGSDTALWQNSEPLLVISADCWDGNFAYPDIDGLGETYFALDTTGTAAHWSSAGLGYSVEHSILHSGFYHAIFHERLLRLGEAVKYAKINYLGLGQHPAEVMAFTLLGDPAMDVIAPRADLSGQVKLQGRLDTPLTAGMIELIDQDGNFAPQSIITSPVDGSFVLRGVPVAPGGSNYAVRAKHGLYLSAEMTQKFTAVPLTLPPVTLRGGDANNDSSISILDLGCMGGKYQDGVGDCGGQGSTDINGDGATTIQDLAIAGGNYSLSSYQAWIP